MFTVVDEEDVFAVLSEAIPGWASSYAHGDIEDAFPKTARAARYATAAIKNALLVRYTDESVDAFGPDDADDEMLLHWRNLAVYERASNGGGRAESAIEDYDRAREWLALVRKGNVVVSGLVQRKTVGKGSGGKGFVRYRGKRRVFDRANGDYDSRNPRI